MREGANRPKHLKLPLVFEPQPEGGYTVTSPLLPELVTEGDTMDDAIGNVRDALSAVVEIYRQRGQKLPASLLIPDAESPLWAEMVVAQAPPAVTAGVGGGGRIAATAIWPIG